jgi:hypothetical protein
LNCDMTKPKLAPGIVEKKWRCRWNSEGVTASQSGRYTCSLRLDACPVSVLPSHPPDGSAAVVSVPCTVRPSVLAYLTLYFGPVAPPRNSAPLTQLACPRGPSSVAPGRRLRPPRPRRGGLRPPRTPPSRRRPRPRSDPPTLRARAVAALPSSLQCVPAFLALPNAHPLGTFAAWGGANTTLTRARRVL